MTYSCSDFTDDILDKLVGLGLIKSDAIDPDATGAQADLACNAIDALVAQAKTLLAMTNDLDGYLREIRAENVDGSEPELSELLGRSRALRLACTPAAAHSHAAGATAFTAAGANPQGSGQAGTTVGMGRFFRTEYTVVVLSEVSPATGLSLADLDYAIGEGDCCGSVTDDGGKELKPLEMLKALTEVGSDAGFFALDHLQDACTTMASADPLPTTAGPVDLIADDAMGKIGFVIMHNIVGPYEDRRLVPEWKWVEEQASLHHVQNGEDAIWEFGINLANDCEVPEMLRPVMAEAIKKGLAYLVFYQD